MKITRIIPAALALLVITAGAAFASQHGFMGHGFGGAANAQNCSGYTTMQNRHNSADMQQRHQYMRSGWHESGRHMMSGNGAMNGGQPMPSGMTPGMNGGTVSSN